MQVCSKASPWGVRLHLDRDERCRWSVIRSPLGRCTTPSLTRCAPFISHPGASRSTSHPGQEQSEQPAALRGSFCCGFADLSNGLRCSFDHAADAGSWRHMVRYHRDPRRMPTPARITRCMHAHALMRIAEASRSRPDVPIRRIVIPRTASLLPQALPRPRFAISALSRVTWLTILDYQSKTVTRNDTHHDRNSSRACVDVRVRRRLRSHPVRVAVDAALAGRCDQHSELDAALLVSRSVLCRPG